LLGVYLPFWAFEGLVSITVPYMPTTTEIFRPGVFSVSDTLVCGGEQLPQVVLAEMMPYHLDALVPYDARYLATWPAQLYHLDVIQASITGRAYIKHAARRQSMGYDIPEAALARTDASDYNPPNTPLWRAARVEIEGLNYRLVLLPVWLITLYLRNGQHLPAAVNGQTGEAIIAASFARFDSIIAGPDRAPVQDLPLPHPPPIHRSVIRPIEPPDRATPRRNVIRRISPPGS
ncbi:MAG: hypothetical protein GYB65_18020, partial [Chloroflexi bacterium]|nr:hypothetical protein [Chloroflexota bacterium]